MAEDIFRPRFSEEHAQTLLYLFSLIDGSTLLEGKLFEQTKVEYEEFRDWFRKSYALHGARKAVNNRFQSQT